MMSSERRRKIEITVKGKTKTKEISEDRYYKMMGIVNINKLTQVAVDREDFLKEFAILGNITELPHKVADLSYFVDVQNSTQFPLFDQGEVNMKQQDPRVGKHPAGVIELKFPGGAWIDHYRQFGRDFYLRFDKHATNLLAFFRDLPFTTAYKDLNTLSIEVRTPGGGRPLDDIDLRFGGLIETPAKQPSHIKFFVPAEWTQLSNILKAVTREALILASNPVVATQENYLYYTNPQTGTLEHPPKKILDNKSIDLQTYIGKRANLTGMFLKLFENTEGTSLAKTFDRMRVFFTPRAPRRSIQAWVYDFAEYLQKGGIVTMEDIEGEMMINLTPKGEQFRDALVEHSSSSGKRILQKTVTVYEIPLEEKVR
jgi:hypothetical protein